MLTERQLLEAMLLRSANDVAYSLALWDAGDVPSFVAKMNATATQLGTTSTHYVDASGYDPGSVSTAADCLRIAAADMAIPTFAEIVGMSSVDLPLVGPVPNVVSQVGSNGIIGVKSGYTSQAKAGMVLAADRTIDGRPVLVMAAVLTQPVPAAIVPPTTTTTTKPRPANARPGPDHHHDDEAAERPRGPRSLPLRRPGRASRCSPRPGRRSCRSPWRRRARRQAW